MTTIVEKETIRNTIIGLISDAVPDADFDELAETDNVREELDIDSFDFLNVIIAIEERLAVTIPESDYDKLVTLNNIVDYVADRRS